MLPEFRHLGRHEWQVLRDMRLCALRESPLSFLAEYSQEEKYGQEHWRAEFDRGDWTVGELEGKHVCLAGVTQESGAPAERYLEYVWVAPGFRCRGTAFYMLTDIIDELKDDSVQAVFLWTLLNDNDAAQSLYERLLFNTTHEQQKLDSDPRGRLWELLKLSLVEPRSTATDPP